MIIKGGSDSESVKENAKQRMGLALLGALTCTKESVLIIVEAA
jgi:hypothetical protein